MEEPKKLEQLIREGKQEEFNKFIADKGTGANLEGVDLRNLNLRGFNLRGANLKDSYLRNSDLTGVDLRGANLEGASIKKSKISGSYFPMELSANEIFLSLEHGTKLRMNK